MKIKSILLPYFVCLVVLGAIGQFSAKASSPQKAYIDKYSGIAIEEMRRSGVPASITLAQGLLESNSGRSELAIKGNNHFGIKCHDWKGKKVYFDDDRRGECFRKYEHVEQSFRDHSDFLRYRDRYKFLFDLKPTDYKGWAYGLRKAGYATDPAYPKKLIKLIEEYDLARYDRVRRPGSSEQAHPSTPLPPSELERPTLVKGDRYPEFAFSLTRKLYTQNRVPFIYSVEGETYRSIASRYGLFVRELMRFNDAMEMFYNGQEDEPLMPGTVIYLQKKRNKAARKIEKHVSEGQETLRDVAQRYGVKMRRLQKMNDLDENETLHSGQMIRLR